MSLFKFRALDSQGVAQSGTLQATDRAAAVAALHKRGWLLLHIETPASPLNARWGCCSSSPANPRCGR